MKTDAHAVIPGETWVSVFLVDSSFDADPQEESHYRKFKLGVLYAQLQINLSDSGLP